MYAQFWQRKLAERPIEFPDELCPAIADITKGFSFAYLQELFIASLLQIARGDDTVEKDLAQTNTGDGNLDKYQLWRVLKRQADILREDMGQEDAVAASNEQVASTSSAVEAQAAADSEIPFLVSSRGWAHRRVEEVQPRDTQPVLGRRRLTPQQALGSLTKSRQLGERAFEWTPMPGSFL